MEKKQILERFSDLLDIMDRLREECPWDREQTLESLRSLTIEETYELSEAILKGDLEELSKELGDLLLHIVFYARIGKEEGAFDIGDVIARLSDKLVFRHPHVFGDVRADNAGTVIQNWEHLKTKEKNGNKSVLSGVPAGLPALIKSYRIQDKARAMGFDWEKREQVWDKVTEEVDEFRAEWETGNEDRMEAEFGDLLFALVNAARLYGINPENALERTNRTFISRFNYLEKKTIKQGRSLEEMTPAQMDSLWEEAKHNQGE
ncbi:MAG: nucleoside triphosphate pyrophosphohydrolase [Bacteroidales bacterium]|jgi:XTP/dITP diphosphohydrolase|nr:nucleoside triphosphate pyrophosphohydrolase [Bacteroidales bacterium]MDD2824002.1 nucleoside triphosphate pyrophosphohydrolase [Bacteroidales bacterium]MDD3101132.1 nucleoside triphosphate pyrophosphohydrolase [Bacteroidales bacterium]MDD3639940.1 nucleoside triphosphate pyrophosphohydrolase [Bacteroidales bacterium]MDD3944652.1 nucleoside triphosphate pyrophosphohydrolase [Bacteroidales bacterium]